MNILLKTISIISICACSSVTQGQNDGAINKVQNFYEEYLAAFGQLDWPRYEVVTDSLQKSFCSKSLLQKIEKNFQETDGAHDLITNDYGADMISAATLTLIPTTNPSEFKVSYKTTFTRNGRDTVEKVEFKVGVITESDSLKLDYIVAK